MHTSFPINKYMSLKSWDVLHQFYLIKWWNSVLNKSNFSTYTKEQLLHEQPLKLLYRMMQIRAARK